MKKRKASPSKYSPRARSSGRKNIRGRYPALNPAKNLKIRQEMLEGMDYVKNLSEKEKKYLDAFMDGHNNANVRKSVRHKIFKTQKDKSVCHAINNSRNKDAYARAKSKNFLMYDNVPDFWLHADEQTKHNSHEQVAVDLLDIKIEQQKIIESSKAFISEVKLIQKMMPDMIRELRAASSMAKDFLEEIKCGELAPEGINKTIQEGTSSLMQLQADEKDVSYDTGVLREEFTKYAKLIEQEEHTTRSTKKKKN